LGEGTPNQSSDDPSDDDDEDATSSVTSSIASGASNQRTREKLQLHVEKQVVQDIEDNGGIAVFNAGKTQGTCSLLDNPERSNLYGPRGGPLRDKIRKRIQVFKKWDVKKYLTHLKKLGVKRSGKNKTPGRAPSPLPDAIQEEKEADVSDLEEEAFTSPARQSTYKKASSVQKTTKKASRGTTDKHQESSPGRTNSPTSQQICHQ
jgi:hypothetical protein